MAPLPSNNTAVLFVDYTTCGVDHTFQVRFDVGSTVGEALDEAAAFLAALDPGLALFTIRGARVRAAASDVTLPVAWTGLEFYGSGNPGRAYGALYANFVGRSVGGRRARVGVYGWETLEDGGDYRATLAEDANIAAALAVLNASEGTFLAIDGLQPFWQSYSNLGVNAYWRNKIR